MQEEKYAGSTSRGCGCIWCSLLWSKLWQLEPICCDQMIQIYRPLEAYLSGIGTSNTIWCTLGPTYVFVGVIFLGWLKQDKKHKILKNKLCEIPLVMCSFQEHVIWDRLPPNSDWTCSRLRIIPDFNDADFFIKIDLCFNFNWMFNFSSLYFLVPVKLESRHENAGNYYNVEVLSQVWK